MTEHLGMQFWKKLKDIQENSKSQFNKLTSEINEQKEFFTKEIETIEKNQTQALELKNSINEVQNELMSFANRTD